MTFVLFLMQNFLKTPWGDELPRIARKNVLGLHCNVGPWSELESDLSKVVSNFDNIVVIMIKGNLLRAEWNSAIFFVIKVEVLVEFLLIELFIIHDLEEFFKFLHKVIISRFIEFLGPSFKGSTSGSAKEFFVEFIIAPNKSFDWIFLWN